MARSEASSGGSGSAPAQDGRLVAPRRMRYCARSLGGKAGQISPKTLQTVFNNFLRKRV
ncbi:unnamed protein product [Leptidea sinapis]|uniref:Uncharacterized protein n=1 Tax=Leptidea sinapis TaxID=189913 RepID=A0A5E4PYT5_9NEOP|nr:unnamed protein product [Leptidea sinapis]